MKSWTRTLNLDDAHSLLALATPGRSRADWTQACHEAMPGLSMPRRRELVRLLRDGFLAWTKDDRVAPGLFLRFYERAPAAAQLDLVDLQWAMSHPLTLVAVEALVAPRVAGERDPAVPLDEVEALVAAHLETASAESLRKTRTVLLGAMEGIGTLVGRGTGQHRSLQAARGAPHPVGFAYLLALELQDRARKAGAAYTQPRPQQRAGADERGEDDPRAAQPDADHRTGPRSSAPEPARAQKKSMTREEAVTASLPVRLTQCGRAHAESCLSWCLERGWLVARGDEIVIPDDPGARR